jgi:SAM-dependent methyltransferase
MRDRRVLEIYRDDLAHIHNAGFGAFAKASADYLSEFFRTPPNSIGRVVDVGCGSGISTCVFADAGFSVVGIDSSPAMIQLARDAAPRAEFIQASVYEVALPQCDAVVALGEVLNYHGEPDQAFAAIRNFVRSAHVALRVGGLFIFDVIVSGSPSLDSRTWAAGEDWAILVNTTEDAGRRLLVREIEIFRAKAECYRRTHERHVVRVLDRDEVSNVLTEFGFDVEVTEAYGATPLLPRRIAVTARRK